MIIGIIGALFSGGSFLLQVKGKVDKTKRDRFLAGLMRKGIGYLEICKHFHSSYQEIYFLKWKDYFNDYGGMDNGLKGKQWEEFINYYHDLREQSGVLVDLENLDQADIEEIKDEGTVNLIKKFGIYKNVIRFSAAFSKVIEKESNVYGHINNYNNVFEEKGEFKSSLHKVIERGLRSIQINTDIALKELISILYIIIHRGK